MNAITLDLDVLGVPAEDTGLTANDFVVGSNYVESGGPKPIVGRVVVDSPTNVTAFSAAITENRNAEDVLGLTDYGLRVARAFRITVSYDADTGTLTFGTPTILGVNQGVVSVLFREVTFRNTGTTPQSNDRAIAFSVTDQNSNVATAVSVLTVEDTNDAPELTVPATFAAIDEDATLNFSGVSVTDSDDDVLAVTITAKAADVLTGSFSFPGEAPADVMVKTNDIGTITLEGKHGALNAALALLTYSMGKDANGTVAFTFIAVEVKTASGQDIDGPLSAEVAMATLVVNPVNDAPVVNEDLTFTVNEDESGTATTIAALIASGKITDVDGDVLGIAVTGVTIPELDGTPVAALEFKLPSGDWTTLTVETDQALLLGPDAQIRVVSLLADFNTAENPDLKPTISFRGWDQTEGASGNVVIIGATGGEAPFSATEGTLTVEIAAVNDAPVIDLDPNSDGTGFAKELFELPDFVLGTGEPPVQGYVVPEPDFDLGSALPDITDVDSPFIARIDIQITTDGTTAVDGTIETLDLGIDGIDLAPLLLAAARAETSWNADTATLSIVPVADNTDGIAIDQASLLIHSVFYRNTSLNPTFFGDNPQRQIVFTVTDIDANGDTHLTASAISTLTIVDYDNAPTIAAPAEAIEIDSDETVTLSTVTISDVDSRTATLRIDVSAGPDSAKASQFTLADGYTPPAPLTFSNSGDQVVIGVDMGDPAFVDTTDYLPLINTLLANLVYTPALDASFATLGEDFIVTVTVTATGDYEDPLLFPNDTVETFTIKVKPALGGTTLSEDAPIIAEDTASGIIVITPEKSFAELEFTAVSNGTLFLVDEDGNRGAEVTLNTRIALDFASDGSAIDSLRVIFVPDENFNDAGDAGPAGFSVRSAIGDGPDAPRGTAADFTPTVTQVNDAPVLSFNGNETFPTDAITLDEDTTVVFSTATSNAITLSDVDEGEGGELPTVTLSVTDGGTLTLGSIANVIVIGDGSASVTVTGAIADINAALDGLTYQPAQDFNGSATLTITANDNGLGGAPALEVIESITFDVAAVNDAPVATVVAKMVDEDGSVLLSGFGVSDVDSGTESITATLSTTVGAPAPRYAFTLDAATLPGVLGGTFDVPEEAFELVLASPVVADGKVSVQSVIYGGATYAAIGDSYLEFSGGALVAADVTSDKAEGTVGFYYFGTGNMGRYFTDGSQGYNGGTITLNDLGLTGDAFGALMVDATDIHLVSGGDGTGRLTLTGTAAELDAALGRVTFRPAADFNGNVTATLTVDDGGNTGSGGALSDTKTTTITVTPVNDAPVASGTATLAAIDEDTENPAGATVADLFAANFSDAADDVPGGSSADTLEGIIVTSIDDTTGKGVWQVRLSDTDDWTPLSLGTDAGVFLSRDAELRFVPDADWSGEVPALEALLVETGSGFADGETFATLPETGGTTRISQDTVSLTTTVTPVADDPAIAVTNITTPETDDVIDVAPKITVAVTDADGSEQLTRLLLKTDEEGAPGSLIGFELVIKGTVAVVDGEGSYGPHTFVEAGTDAAGNRIDVVVSIMQVDGAFPLEVTVQTQGVQSLTLNDGTTDLGFRLPANLAGEFAFTVQAEAQDGDDLALSPQETVSVTVTPVADAPSVTGVEETATIDEDAAYTLTGTVALVDRDGSEAITALTLTSAAALSLGGASLAGGDIVSVTVKGLDDAETTVDATVAISGDTVTLSFDKADGVADIALSQFSAAKPANVAENFSVTVTATSTESNNTTATSVAQTTTVTMTPVADAPSVTGVEETATIDEDAAYTLTGTVALVDRDGSEAITALVLTSAAALSLGGTALANGATVSVTVKGLDGDDKPVNATVAISGDTVTLSFDKADGVADIALSQFSAAKPANVAENFSVTVTATSTESNNTTATSVAQTTTVTMTPVADAPSVVAASPVTADEGSVADVTGSATLVDIDGSEALVALTFTLPEGTQLTVDGVAIAAGALTVSVTDTADAVKDVIATVSIVEGAVTLAFDAAAAVKSVSLAPFGAGFVDPNANGSFTVGITATSQEGTDTENQATNAVAEVTVNIAAVNDAPVAVAPAAATTEEDTELAFTGPLALSVSDIDLAETPGGVLTVTLSVTNGTLALDTAGVNVTDGDSGQSSITFEGVEAAVNTALAALVYTPAQDFNTGAGGSETLTFTVFDNGNTGSGDVLTVTKTVPITVTAVNDAPVVSAPASVAATEDEVFSFTGANAITVSDVDLAETPDAVLKVTLSVSFGTIALETSGVSVLIGESGTATVTIQGSAEAVNTALATLSYEGNENFNSTRGSEKLVVTVVDLGNTGTGDAQVTVFEIAIDVAPVNDAPVAVTDTAATDQDTSVVVDVLANDTDPDFGDTPPDVLTVTAVIQPLKGSVTLVEGVVTFDPGTAFRSLKEGQTELVTFGYTVADSGGLTDTATVFVTVTGVNDAPEITVNAGATVDEGASITITAEMLEATDIDGDELTFTVTTLPVNGSLQLNGSTLALNGAFTPADINAGRLTYVHDGSETLVDGFGVSVSDGSLTDMASFAITVAPVNDAPTSTGPASVTTLEDTPVAITGLSVADSDADIEIDGAGGTGVTVTLAVTNGTLTLGTVGDVIFGGDSANGEATLNFTGSVAAVNAALATLTYTPGLNFNTKADGLVENLVFDVTDNGNTGKPGPKSAPTRTIPITVTPVNDAPTLTGSLAAPIFEEGIADKTGSAVFLAAENAFTAADVDLLDSPADTLAGASLVVDLTANRQPDDVLSVAERNGVTVEAGNVSFGGGVVATVAGGTGNVPLTITFTTAATEAAVARVLEAVQFDNQSAIPDGLDGAATSRTVEVVFNDGRGGSAAPVTGTITITPVNDAPTANAPGRDGLFTVEDNFDADVDAVTVADFLTDGTLQTVSDPDNQTVSAGIAITAVSNVNGVYVYRLPDDDDFTVIPADVSAANALVLGPDAVIGFRPTTLNFNTDFGGDSGSISYRIWDQGPAVVAIVSGDRADTRKGVDEVYREGEGPFSDAVFTTSAEVASINDAPEIAGPATQTIAEDTSITFSVDNNNALTVSDVDIDEDGVGTILVTVTATRGTLVPVEGAGVTVTGSGTAIITLDGPLAAVNSALDGLVFTPDPDQNGDATITVTANDKGNTSFVGDSQETMETFTVTITAVNDAPVVAAGEEVRRLAPINEDVLIDPAVTDKDGAAPGATVADLIGLAFDDSKDAVSGGSNANQLAGIAITANAATTEGVWRYKLAEDGGWATGLVNLVPTDVSETSAFVLPADATLRFEPAVNFNDDVNRDGNSATDIDFGLTARLIEDSAGPVTAAVRMDVTGGNAGGTTSVSVDSVVIETGVIGVPDVYRFLAREDAESVVVAGDVVTDHTAVPGVVDNDGNPSSAVGDIIDVRQFDFESTLERFEFDIGLFNGMFDEEDFTESAFFAAAGSDDFIPVGAMIATMTVSSNRGLAAAVDTAVYNNSLGRGEFGTDFSVPVPMIVIAFNQNPNFNDGGIVFTSNRYDTGDRFLLARFDSTFRQEDLALFSFDNFAIIA